MPEVRDSFPDLENLDIGALHERRNNILASANGDFEKLPDEPLAELLQIGRVLRRKAAAPGGPGKARKSKAPATLSDLA